MNIKKFEDFNHFSLIVEMIHINKEVDEYSDKICEIISGYNKSKFQFEDLPTKLNISKLFINIIDMKSGLYGQLDLDKSKQTKNRWEIYINLKRDFSLYTLKHELNHALRVTLIGKDKMIKNLNYIKSQNIFAFSKDKEMDYFFYLMYLANDEEINAKVMETNGFIKEVMNKWGVYKISRNGFDYIIKSSDAYKQSNELINFKCDSVFKNWNENKLNKLFSILEENKKELDKIQDSSFSKLKLIIKSFKDIIQNRTVFNREDKNIYNPKKGKKFYDTWIPSQGEKLKRSIYSLYEHYSYNNQKVIFFT
jgi:hypothetical protein